MAASRSPQQAEWQSTRVPKLSYRKALPQEELDKINHPPREYVPPSKPITRDVSVREPVDKPVVVASIQPPPKKKSSILAGFFSKEPTISALAQVEADLTAKHGAATPQTVPHVSSRKMPEHVPKVNSRWDGVPEIVKIREREERQRKRFSQQSNQVSTQPRYYSQDSDEYINDIYPGYSNQRNFDTESQCDSSQSRDGISAGPQRHESYSSASSSNASLEVRHRQTASLKSQSLKSPSGNSLPEITNFFPHHETSKAKQPEPISQALPKGPRAQSTKYSNSRPDTTPIDAIPEHSISPVTTPGEVSPATPVYFPNRERPSRGAKHTPMDAFLAGEAKPLELDEDDFDSVAQARPQQTKANVAGAGHISRKSRSELKPSGVVRREAAPWEKEEPAFTKPAVPLMSKNRTPKVLAVRSK